MNRIKELQEERRVLTAQISELMVDYTAKSGRAQDIVDEKVNNRDRRIREIDSELVALNSQGFANTSW